MGGDMNEFVPRIEPTAAERIAPARAAAPVATVPQVDGAAQAAGQTDVNADDRREQARQEARASVADYTKVRTQIADIMAELSAARTPAPQARAQAERALNGMMPPPVVLIPMPPASRDVLEHAVRVANEIAQQANLARAAQANATPSLVEHVLAVD